MIERFRNPAATGVWPIHLGIPFMSEATAYKAGAGTRDFWLPVSTD
jgi:hypothetical protein